MFWLWWMIGSTWTSAHAQDLIRIEVVRKALLDDEPPALIVSPRVDVSALLVRVICGPVARAYDGPLPAGDTLRLSFPVPAGEHTCFGQLLAEFVDGSLGEIPLDFAVTRLAPAKIRLDRSELDVSDRRAVVAVDRPIVQLVFGVYDIEGNLLGGATRPLGSHPANLPVVVRWQQKDGEAFRVVIRAQDVDGFWASSESVLWRASIDAPPIRFRRDAQIRRRSLSALEASWTQIDAATGSLPSRTPIKLFLTAETDAQARALATWFRDRGWNAPIRFRIDEETTLFLATEDQAATWRVF